MDVDIKKTVLEYIRQHPTESFSSSIVDKERIAKELKLKTSSVGWALWNLKREGVIQKPETRTKKK